MNRNVTERDFRMPEFKDANVEDYEFRGDGKIVRKDRWEMGIRDIAAILDISSTFEIDDVVSKIQDLDYARRMLLKSFSFIDDVLNDDAVDHQAPSILQLREFANVHPDLLPKHSNDGIA